jgi:tRNA threonylcarbamoyladenosine biosynthesis protein TsaE
MKAKLTLLGEFASLSPEATTVFAAVFGRAAQAGTTFLLQGELGAGKTHFVRGLAAGLGLPADDPVTSPTFVLQHVHHAGRLPLYHMDAYRLSGGRAEFEASGLAVGVEAADGVACIEWPERLDDPDGVVGTPPAELFRGAFRVELEHVGPETRSIRMWSPSNQAAAAKKIFAAACREAGGRS